jgi:3-hydroxyisobutyrate dehydrogenase-like beta-hydroxyacid dehydrogenase
MKPRAIGILHPGSMGVSIAAAAKNNGNTVYWAAHDRSPQSQDRATDNGLLDAGDLAAVCSRCEIIFCVCPPHAAETVAEEVIAAGFKGLYLDANAIAPQRARRIGDKLETAGASYVDGGIIGGPAWGPAKTWLHLSGKQADQIAACFGEGPLVTNVLGPAPDQASALKMCFAAQTKGTAALMCAILAAAEHLGVRQALFEQWSHGGSDRAGQAADQVRGVTGRAWRWEGEMREISETFATAGVPGDFHAGAAGIFGRLAGFKDATAPPELETVLAALLEGQD